MSKIQLHKIAQGKIWKFFGGIHPKEMKNASNDPIEELPLPSLISLPVERHLGDGGRILVKTGDYVKKGQQLTEPAGERLVPLHASTSGTVISISQEVLPHPSGFTGLNIVIKPDGLDLANDRMPIANWRQSTNSELLDRIRNFGIEGLGGAQFQTAVKLSSALKDCKECSVFIVNGCECEPIVCCDDRIMQEKSSEIALGIEIIKKILNPRLTVIAIEENKKAAIEAMKKAALGIAEVRVLPVKYPTGAARNLIKAVTGIEVPYDVHTSECGIVVDNVATILAVKEAVIDGIPLTSRVVTVDGGALKRRGNVKVRFGTSVRFLLANFGLTGVPHQRIILGGPMMGFTLPHIDVPIVKSVNAVIAPGERELSSNKRTYNCIRCGRCARVCPSRLVPYQLYSQSKALNHAGARKCGIKDCMLCGSCSFVCPSGIPLTAQFRYEQAAEKLISEAEYRNKVTRERKEAHEQRLQEEARIRAQKKAAALARIKAQQEAEAKMTPEEREAARKQALELAKQRALARKAMLKAQSGNAALGGDKEKRSLPSQAVTKRDSLSAESKTSGQRLPDSLKKNDC